MRLLRSSLKLGLLVGHILIGLLLSWLLFLPLLPLPTGWSSAVVRGWSGQLCRLLGLQIRCYGTAAATPTLFVANHISWLDIFALLATFPVTFVAKQEIAHWPILGRLVSRVGTLFIQRGQFRSATTAANAMTHALLKHQNILFFPEGTSTTGVTVKRFHARLFQVALQAEVPVQPIAIRYPQGTGVNPVIPYVDDDVFATHVWRLLGEKHILVELWFCPPILAQGQERRALADYAQQQISMVLQQSEKQSDTQNKVASSKI